MSTEAPETVSVSETRIACDGGGALGHPKIYLQIGEEGFVECPYCDRRFVLDRASTDRVGGGSAAAGGHSH